MEADVELPKLSAEALSEHVTQNRYSIDSLLGAYRHGGDTNWLHLAARQFPDDPRVQLEVLGADLYPDNRLNWLEAFKQSAPENSLANYLAAAHHLKNGDMDAAIQELDTGNQKSQFSAYLAETMQNSEELYVQAGNAPLDSKAKAFAEVEFPHLPELRGLSKGLLEYQDQLRAGGNGEGADHLTLMGLSLAQHLSLGDGNRTFINQLVGLAIEQSFLEHLNIGQAYPSLPMPVPDMLEAVNRQKETVRDLALRFNQALTTSDETLLQRYFDRIKVFGEYEAAEWLLRQHSM
jgi:hypothetical protein